MEAMLKSMKSAMSRVQTPPFYKKRLFTERIICRKQIRRIGSNIISNEPPQYTGKANSGELGDFYENTTTCFMSKYSFTTNRETADFIAERILPFIRMKKECAVLEINPGLGLVTEALLERGVPEINLWDNPLKGKSILRLPYKFVDRVVHHEGNACSRGRLHDFLDFYEMINKWKDSSLMVLEIAPSRCFFRRCFEVILLHDMTLFHNTELFVLLEEGIYQCLTNSNEEYAYPIDYVFFSCTMDMTIIAELPRDHFLPKNRNTEEKHMFFTRITRKKWMEHVTQDELRLFFSFMHLFRGRKHGSVVKILESYYPDCGVHLIKEGLSVATHIRELDGKDMFSLFKLFNSLDGAEGIRSILNSHIRDRLWVGFYDLKDVELKKRKQVKKS